MILQACNISKSFPGVKALEDVHLHVEPGEVLAVIGENGAGKSTLMKILAGIQPPDRGEIRVDGEAVRFTGVKQAEEKGIVLIHQELSLAEHLDVAANVYLGREPSWGGPLRLIRRRIYDDAEKITRRLGLSCSPRARVADLTPAQQQLVEIARALSQRSRVLILDEPTSSLTTAETERLFIVLRQLRSEGMSLVYISHRLREIEEIADRVTALRDGRNAGELSRAEIGHDAMVRLMVGRELKQFYERQPPAPRADTPAVLEVRGLRWSPRQRAPISFELYPGEIVGMAGLIGSGRTELAETLFGIRPRLAGEVIVAGQAVNIRTPRQAIAAGVFLIPEDRRSQGLILADSIKHNISLPSLDLVSLLGWVRRPAETAIAERLSARLGVRTTDVDKTVGLLSGGNQQKVVLAKWLARHGRVLIFDEPTRGVDVGAKKEIYALMDELARSGLAILMISSDMEEVLGISERVLVMHEWELAGAVGHAQLSEVAIMNLATGKGTH
jgi:ribose transport system ATP-binding protein